MNLTHDQKQFIRKNYKTLSPKKVAEELKLNKHEVEKYIAKKYNFNHTKTSDNNDIKKVTIDKNKIWPIFLALAIIVLIVYANSIGNGFVSDDIDAIAKNPNIGNLSFLLQNPKNLINSLVYFFLFKIGGLQPSIFRIYNILLHIGSVFLVYVVILMLSGKKKIALMTSFIFAIHPLLIESIAWISGRPYTQYTFFLLLSFYFYLKSESKQKFYYLSILTFILGVLSSEKAIAFPLIIFLYDFSFGKLKTNWKKTAGFFLLLLIGGLYFGSQIGTRLQSVTALSAGAAGKNLNIFYTLPVAISSYFDLIFWPKDLTLYHSEMTFSQVQFGLRALVFLIYTGLTIFFYKKNRLIFFFLAFFTLALSPTLTPFGISWIVAERYAYFASIGIFFCVAYAFNYFLEQQKYKEIALYSFVFLIIALSVRTIVRNSDWTNEDTLWLATGKTSPSSQSTHNNLGDVYARHKDYPNAILEFKKSIQINPNYADAWHNLALTYESAGDLPKAIETYKHAVSINPNLWQSYENLARIYFSQNNLVEARKMLEKLVEINPQKSAYYVNIGIIDLKERKTQDAKNEFLKALEVNPQDEDAKKELEQIKL